MASTADIFAEQTDAPVTTPASTDELGSTPERIIQTRDFHGRQVKFRSFSDTQLAQMNHEATILTSDRHDTERKRKAMDRCFRTLQTMFVDEEDMDFAAELIADGELDLRELMTIAMELVTGTEPNRQVRRATRSRRR